MRKALERTQAADGQLGGAHGVALIAGLQQCHVCDMQVFGVWILQGLAGHTRKSFRLAVRNKVAPSISAANW